MSDTPKIELVQGEIASVSLKPGDRLVLMFPYSIRPDVAVRLQELMADWAPDIPCVVIGEGGRLGVIRQELDAIPAAGDFKG